MLGLVLIGAAVATALFVAAAARLESLDNMDSLTYHLARAAAWAQHGGLYWIPHAPEVELNAYQPLAEQQDLFYLVATGGGAFYAAPQYLAELAILVAVYGSSGRLGFEVRTSARTALPFFAPALVIGAAGLLAFGARRFGFRSAGPAASSLGSTPSRKMEPLAGSWSLAVDPRHRSRRCG